MTFQQDSSVRTVMWNSVMAGTTAGVVSTLVCHPFDVLRVKMQNCHLQKGIYITFRETLHEGGIRALWTGLTLPLAAQAVYKSTVFSINNVSLQAIVHWKSQGSQVPATSTELEQFMSGALAGGVNALLFVTPVEFVRNNQITPAASTATSVGGKLPTTSLGPITLIKATIETHGIRGLWRGSVSTILRDSVGCGSYFLAMAYTQKCLTPEGETPHYYVRLASGAMAGIAYWLVALPLDTMKTWIQSGKAQNLRHAFQLASQNGWYPAFVALTRGWEAAYARGAPSAAITISTYGIVYDYLTHMVKR
eukprot:Nitzschia sp. Nitz4//scaffold107_size73032//60957//61877//NITZ4_005770-RA/size73032-processed-gene-0.113-mRNA-1//1//CDS//3329532623//5069//frame0